MNKNYSLNDTQRKSFKCKEMNDECTKQAEIFFVRFKKQINKLKIGMHSIHVHFHTGQA